MIDFKSEIEKFAKEHAMVKPTPLVEAAIMRGSELAYCDASEMMKFELHHAQHIRNGGGNGGSKSGTITALEIPSSV